MRLGCRVKIKRGALLGVAVGLAAGGAAYLWSADLHGTRVADYVVSDTDTIAKRAAPKRAVSWTAGGGSSLASLPDRGELLAQTGEPEIHDAYAWHPVHISEGHALAAVVSGTLRLTSPEGKPLSFRYQRHIEHPDGNWTFVGRDGEREAVLTFGERAVFGSIDSPGQPSMRVWTRGGQTWLITTDSARLAEVRNSATHPTAPDYLVPPVLAGGVNTAAESAEPLVQQIMSAAASSGAGTVVDIVLGYTGGFAAGLGGDSQAMTRIHYLVDVVNQAYVNSQVAAKVRLVHAMRVDYPDNTKNQTALEELTGFKAPSTQIAPSLAFSQLRAAREQFGADLVSLVRKFHTPENDGCGIAWLIGGGRTVINSGHEYFGYSVVSDGVDQGEDGKNYFCRDETLAHEFGHNMGSQHDRATATKDGELKYGAYDWSFGYKTDAAQGNFYTVMAYGESGQTRYRVFSNPAVTLCGGYACGVFGQADNARSLNLTIPVIAKFRATVVTDAPRRVTTDVNGDGKSDLFWQNSGNVAFWLKDTLATIGSGYVGKPDEAFRAVAAGDFNDDGFVDLAWTTGNLLMVSLNDGSGNYIHTRSYYYGPDWQPFAAMDIDGDGKEDLLWRNGSHVAHWRMSGADMIEQGYTGNAGDGFRLVAAGDFNGDGLADTALANGTHVKFWINRGSSQFSESGLFGYYASGWQPYASADFNGDGKSDLMWRSGSRMAYWQMDGASVAASVFVGDAGVGDLGESYALVAAGDYNGDGRGDLMFATGNQSKVWLNYATQPAFSTPEYYGNGWRPFDPSLPQYD